MRCSPVAIERGDPIRHTRSTAPTSMPSSSDAVATTSFRSPSFRRRSALWRRSRDRLPWWAATASSPSRSPRWWRHPLDQPPRVDEHQRRPVRARQVGDAVVDLRPLLVGAHGAQLVLGTSMPRSRSRRWPTSTTAGAGRVPHSRRPRPPAAAPSPTARCAAAAPAGVADQRLEPLERQRQVRAALVGGHGVDLVDDHRAHVAQRAPPRIRGQQDVQRLGRGHQDVRRVAHRLAPLARRGVAGAHGRADRRAPGSPARPRPRAARRAAPSRLRRMSFDSALSGET